MSVLLLPAGFLGDIPLNATFGFKFTTYQASGAPIVLGGVPVIQVYKRGSTTEDPSGITLTADYDAVVGLNDVVIDMSADPTFYASGGDFAAVITTGTVNAVSVVGYVVAQWTVGKGVDVTRIGASATSLADLKDFADTGYDPATHNVAEVDSVGALASGAQTNVTTAVIAGVNTARSEPGQGAPAANASLGGKIDYLYKWVRNRKTQTATLLNLYNDDAATIDQKAVVSNNGTTSEKGEIATGP